MSTLRFFGEPGPTFIIGEGLEIHGGIQLLRGGEADNNLGVIGLTLNF